VITSGLCSIHPSNHLYFRDKSILEKHLGKVVQSIFGPGAMDGIAGLAKVAAHPPPIGHPTF